MADLENFGGRVAVVTAGGRGIGAATALKLGYKGVSKIAITYVTNSAAADTVIAELESLPTITKAVAIQADLLDDQYGPKLISATLEQLETDTIDILVNNAPMNDPDKFENLHEVTLARFQLQMQANCSSHIDLTNAMMRYMPASGGRVISVSNAAAGNRCNDDPVCVYSAAKGRSSR